MFECFVCNKKYNAADSVLGHLRFFHSTEIAQKKLVCCWCHCVRVFSNFKAYSTHVRSHKLESAGMSLQSKCISSQYLQDSNNDNIKICLDWYKALKIF